MDGEELLSVKLYAMTSGWLTGDLDRLIAGDASLDRFLASRASLREPGRAIAISRRPGRAPGKTSCRQENWPIRNKQKLRAGRDQPSDEAFC
jgi:hypothetical protein